MRKTKVPPITNDLKQAAQYYHLALTEYNRIFAIVDAYQRRVLAEMQLRPDPQWSDFEPDEPILNPAHTYLLSDADAERYFARLDEEKAKAGFHGLEPGVCPALVARTRVLNAKKQLIRASEYIHGMTWDELSRNTANLEKAVLLVLKYVETRGAAS